MNSEEAMFSYMSGISLSHVNVLPFCDSPRRRPMQATPPLELNCAMEWEPIAAAEGQPTLPRFRMVAYTGSPMRVSGWRYPLVVDLAGLSIPSQARPIRLGVGHTDSIRVERSLDSDPELNIKGHANPVVQVIHEGTGEILYTVRAHAANFQPRVYSKGTYTMAFPTNSGRTRGTK
jgi:hypothetical protein